MNYLSVCSGVEAASVAWKGLGWNPLGFSEIEKFPSEVLNHHYPNVPNLGDMTKYKEWNFGDRSVDLVVGGTPCQSFSVAGLRKGMEDPRGNLALTFCAILDKFRPQWFVWENVPGVLSSNKGRDFGSFLGAVAELRYGASYRVLDAQNFGVPQRRKRVFVVGHLGDWKPTAEVLFESESLRWHPKKSRQTRKNSPGYIASSFGAYSKSDVGGTSRSSGGDLGGGSETFIHVADTAPTLTSSAAGFSRVGNDTTADSQYIAIAENTIGRQPLNGGNGNGFTEGGPMYTLNATGVHGVAHGFEPGIARREGNPSRFTEEKSPTLRANMGDNQVAVAHMFKIRGGSPVETGTQGGTPGKQAGKGYLGQDEKTYTINTTQDQYLLPPIALAENTIGRQPLNGGNGDGFTEKGPMYTLNATGVHGVAHGFEPGIAKREGNPSRFTEEKSPTLRANMGDNQVAVAFDTYNTTVSDTNQTIKSPNGGVQESVGTIFKNMAVRKLTPIECERLQGFPDNYTNIKENCPDGHRYKAMGNSMAVPVMRWIGERINNFKGGNYDTV